MSQKCFRIVAGVLVLYFIAFIVRFELRSSSLFSHSGHDSTTLFGSKHATHHKPKHGAKHLHVPHPPQHDSHQNKNSAPPASNFAFAVVISNEDFIDGALALGRSFLNTSTLVKTKQAALVAVIPSGAICKESIDRLQLAGWNHIYQVHDLTRFARKSHYAGTFNKLYLFNLTEYQRVATFDVDMLMLRSPDAVFSTKLAGPTWIGALGNSHRKNHSYFQTGMMLIVPSKTTFDWLLHEFHSNPHQRDLNGRDGRLIRQYFGDKYVNLDSRLSAHLGVHERLGSVIGFHFRGEFKPWFNKEFPPTKPAFGDKGSAPMEQELGEAYRLWWATYEQFHETHIAPHDVVYLRSASDAEKPSSPYDPAKEVWLMRHTSRSYVQLKQREDEQRRNLTYRALVLELSAGGQTCDELCAERQAVCKGDALSFLEVNSCRTLQQAAGCDTCSRDFPGSDEPSFDPVTRKCFQANLDYKTRRPLCNASLQGHRRLCPCVPLEHAYDAPIAAGEADEIHFGSGDGTSGASLVEDNDEHGSGCFPTRAVSENDTLCTAYLARVDNIAWIGVLGRTPLAGRTVKLMAFYEEKGVKAVIKFPQRLFPHEAHSEVMAYRTDRALRIHRTPPTVFTFLPLELIKAAIRNATNAHADAVLSLSLDLMRDELISFLEGEAGTLTRTRNGKREVGVSVQLWMNDVHRFVDTALGMPEQASSMLTVFRKGGVVGAEIGLMVAFDYIIGNDDRTLTKNCFAVGGCVRHCYRSSPFHFTETPRLMYLDHGRSFYAGSDFDRSALHDLRDVCRLPRDVVAACLQRSVARDSLGTFQKEHKQQSLEHLLLDQSKEFSHVISEAVVNAAQNRLEAVLDVVSECLSKRSAESTVLLP